MLYGFTLSLYEYEATIQTLWSTVKGLFMPFSHNFFTQYVAEFMDKHPDLIESGNAMSFLSDDGGETYNRCHCEYICEIDGRPRVLMTFSLEQL